MGKEFIVNNLDDMCALMCDNNTEGLEANSMSKVILKVEVEEDYLESIKASTNKTSSDIILINATPITESDDAVSRQEVLKKLRGCLTGGEAEYRYVKLHIDSIHSVLPKREQSEWILVSEGLPKVDGSYRVMQKNGSIGTYVFHKDGNSEEYWKRCAVAWMPLSEIP